MLPADFRKVCKNSSNSVKIKLWFPPRSLVGILKKTKFWNWSAPLLLMVKLVMVLWRPTSDLQGECICYQGTQNQASHNALMELFHFLKKISGFTKSNRDKLIFLTPFCGKSPHFQCLCPEMQNWISSVEERPPSEHLLGCSPWRRRGSSSTSFSLLISGSKH